MTVLVTGASGQQGGAVARALIKAGHPVRVMGRAPERLAALQQLGAEVVGADYHHPKSLQRALEGVEKAFLVTSWFEEGCDAEVEQGTTFIDVAKEAGLPYLVYSSVAAADQQTGVPHFESKWKVEQHLDKSAIPHTVLRPVWFMENFASFWFRDYLKGGVLKTPLDPNREIQMVPLAFVGAFGAAALTRQEEFQGQKLHLACDQLTFPDAMAKLSKAIGRTIGYEQTTLESMRAQSEEAYLMFKWFNESGFDHEYKSLERWGISPITFEEHLTRAPWVKEFVLQTAAG